MAARYRVVLEGFGEFEHEALSLCFRVAGTREPAYDQVAKAADSDFIVANADHEGVIDRVLGSGRERDTVFVGTMAPLGAHAHVPRPIDPQHILRELDRIAQRRLDTPSEGMPVLTLPGLGTDSLRFPTLITDDLDTLRGLTVTEVDEMPDEPAVLAEAPPDDAPLPSLPPPPPVDEHTRAKSAARAAARRARLTQAQRSAPAYPGSTDVLVLDDSEVAQAFLCHLLEGFGFRPHTATHSTQLPALLRSTQYAATFLDIVLGEGDPADGIVLCQQIKQARAGRPGAAPVILVSGQSRPSDRVRAQLAGCDAFLTKPLTRGDLARALEQCGVALPSDARRLE